MIEAKLLIVDGESRIRSALKRALKLEGYSVEDVDSGHKALMLLERTPYDLILLDMLMPDIDGMEVMCRARQLQTELLIIVLTSHATLESAIAAVRSDAVDYLQKPINPNLIVEAVNEAINKRAQQLLLGRLIHTVGDTMDALRQVETETESPSTPHTPLDHIVHVHPLALDYQRRQVVISGDSPQTIELTDGEIEVLGSLMAHPNQVLACRQLAYITWGYDVGEIEGQSMIRPHISRLRRKIEIDPKVPQLIRTVRGRGYLFAPPQNKI